MKADANYIRDFCKRHRVVGVTLLTPDGDKTTITTLIGAYITGLSDDLLTGNFEIELITV